MKDKMRKANKIRTMMIIMLLSIISSYSTIKCQDIINSCINQDLSLLDLEITPALLNINSDYKKILENIEVKKWIENINKDNIRMYLLSNVEQKYILLSSTILAATGLSVNFYNWLIINERTGVVLNSNIMNLSCNPKCFHLKSDIFHFTEYKFSDSFFSKRDYHNIAIEKIQYIIENEKLVIIDISEIRCE